MFFQDQEPELPLFGKRALGMVSAQGSERLECFGIVLLGVLRVRGDESDIEQRRIGCASAFGERSRFSSRAASYLPSAKRALLRCKYSGCDCFCGWTGSGFPICSPIVVQPMTDTQAAKAEALNER